ncbi:MAG: tyrosine protein kinase, partial [Bacteroidota bacterium]
MFELGNRLEKTEERSLRKVLLKYLRYWPLFLLGVIFTLGMAFLYLRYMAIPQYRITSTVLIKDKDKGSGVKESESLADLGLVKPSRNVEDQMG